EWERLRVWLNESRGEIQLERQLDHAAEDWLTGEKDVSFLLRGTRLEQFGTWATSTELALTQHERDFLQASSANDQREKAAEQSRQVREAGLERRSRHFLRGLVAVLLLATVGALALSGIAINNANAARTSETAAIAARDQSEANFQLAEARRLAGASTLLLPNTTQNAELAALLALQSLNMGYSAEADAALTQSAPLLYAIGIIPLGNGAAFTSVALSPDERVIATGDLEGAVGLWDAETLQPLQDFPRQEQGITDVEFSPDGLQLLILMGHTDVDGAMSLWDIQSQTRLMEQPINDGYPTRGFFRDTPDGQRIIVSTKSFAQDYAPIYVWQTGSETPEYAFLDRSAGLGQDAAAITQDGSHAAYINLDNELVLRSLEADEIIAVLPEVAGSPVTSIAFSPDGEAIAASNDDGIFIFDVQTESIRLQIPNPIGDAINDVMFSPDGAALLTAGTNAIYLWDAETGGELRRFSGGSAHRRPAFFEGGQRFIAVSDDGIRVWNADQNYLVDTHGFAGNSPSPSPDGSLVVVADAEIHIYDSASGDLLQTLPNDTEPAAFWLEFTPDNRYLFAATPFDPGIFTLWDWRAGEQVWRMQTDYGITQPDISQDGRYLTTPDNDGTARLWNLSNGELIREFHQDYDAGSMATFSADGDTLATSGFDGGAQVWNVDTGELLHTFTMGSATDWIRSVEISPDERLLTTVNLSASITQLWDIETGDLLLEVARTYGMDSTFSHDGRYLAAVVDNNQLALWDTDTLQVVRRVYSDHPGGTRIWFTPDDNIVYVSNWDQTYSRFDVNLSDVRNDVCSRLFRDLAPAERQRYYIADDSTTCYF
ncbi:MAG: WD40 repeat domain-containing protein, partial [Burkholderiales bacterium]|nr:WD40 repeat domain-containing protein [Anaerolineae bacterium]